MAIINMHFRVAGVGYTSLYLWLVGSYATLDRLTPSGPEGSSGRLIFVCRRVPGHFFTFLPNSRYVLWTNGQGLG